ncbi:MAG: TatD family hydrolase [Patescibacteria group bacterium]|nr:TatD family hydrolase [Patescibacteria group bacterium]MDD5294305.1 TatD family hydrolase [Patescibacteria group bacterium]MDD5554128.1 TatD family hydrolase [Patescibacteria group bacterium]
MFIDTHAHVNFNAFNQDADEVIRRSLAGDTWMVLVGSEYKTSRKGLDYANKYEKGVYAAVGLHPVHLDDLTVANDDENGEYSFRAKAEEFNYDSYEKLAKFEKVVAIGEIGLDYYHINLAGNVSAIKKKQQEIFEGQLLLARNLDLPVIIHCRQAHDDMLAVLSDFKKKYKDMIPVDRPWGVMHCFSGDEDLAWKYFSLGLIISFTGLITFSKRWDDLIRKMPPEKFMIETDCPYMTPEPYRGKRNEPLLVKYVAARIGEIRNLSPERVGEITSANAREFFNI